MKTVDIHPDRNYDNGTSLVHCRGKHSKQENKQKKQESQRKLLHWEEDRETGELEQKTINLIIILSILCCKLNLECIIWKSCGQ